MTQSVDLANAINTFVKGCKTDGTWDAMKACCIMAAWDGLTGALYPLKGTAPTNNNFVAADYNRETGLVGDGSTKSLNSNRANNVDPQNNAHRSVHVTAAPTLASRNYYGSDGISTSGGDNLFTYSTNQLSGASRGTGSGSTEFTIGGQGYTTGFKGISRSVSGSYQVRTGGGNTTVNKTSQTPDSGDIFVFARGPSSASLQINARMSFYSIGESLDLALLDARVSTLMTDIGAAIP